MPLKTNAVAFWLHVIENNENKFENDDQTGIKMKGVPGYPLICAGFQRGNLIINISTKQAKGGPHLPFKTYCSSRRLQE